MKLIIEGPDNVGKSTLIRALLKEFQYPFLCMHSYAPPTSAKPNDIELFHLSLYESMFQVFKSQKYVISDRFYPGSFVYSKLYNRGISGDFVLDLESKNIDILNDCILIVLIDTPENLVKREDGLSIEKDISYKIEEVKLYKRFFNISKVKNKILIDVNGINPDNLSEIVQEKIREVYLDHE